MRKNKVTDIFYARSAIVDAPSPTLSRPRVRQGGGVGPVVGFGAGYPAQSEGAPRLAMQDERFFTASVECWSSTIGLEADYAPSPPDSEDSVFTMWGPCVSGLSRAMWPPRENSVV